MTTNTTTTIIMTTTTPSSSSSNQTDPLASVPFLVNLAETFHVKSIPLAIFILILVCIACILFLTCLILCVRTCVRQKYSPKRQKKRIKGIYVDEIPGLVQNTEQSKYGSLEYSLEYRVDLKELRIGVIQANNLVGPPGVEALDPYATVTLAEDDNSQHLKIIGKQEKTNVIQKTNKPCWQNIFKFSIQESHLCRAHIIFEIYDYDSICQDTSIGKLEIALKDLDPAQYAGQVLEKVGWLTAGSGINFGLGELCIGLGYYPHSSRIDICIYEARQLQFNHIIPTTKQRELDVMIYFKNQKQTLHKGKTNKRKEMLNPYFNHKLTYSLSEKYLNDTFIICKLRHIDRVRMKRVLGTVYIGNNSPQTSGVKQWEEMIKGPSKMHVMWHSLSPKE